MQAKCSFWQQRCSPEQRFIAFDMAWNQPATFPGSARAPVLADAGPGELRDTGVECVLLCPLQLEQRALLKQSASEVGLTTKPQVSRGSTAQTITETFPS